MGAKRSIINVNKKQGSLRIKQAERKLNRFDLCPDLDNANVGIEKLRQRVCHTLVYPLCCAIRQQIPKNNFRSERRHL